MGMITTSNGTEIFFKDWGSGQAIVFSHGASLLLLLSEQEVRDPRVGRDSLSFSRGHHASRRRGWLCPEVRPDRECESCRIRTHSTVGGAGLWDR
jgi:hypothetical protein